MRPPKKQKPPYKISLELPIGHARLRVRLPAASQHCLGERVTLAESYHGHAIRINLIRIEGGWDIEETTLGRSR